MTTSDIAGGDVQCTLHNNRPSRPQLFRLLLTVYSPCVQHWPMFYNSMRWMMFKIKKYTKTTNLWHWSLSLHYCCNDLVLHSDKSALDISPDNSCIALNKLCLFSSLFSLICQFFANLTFSQGSFLTAFKEGLTTLILKKPQIQNTECPGFGCSWPFNSRRP